MQRIELFIKKKTHTPPPAPQGPSLAVEPGGRTLRSRERAAAGREGALRARLSACGRERAARARSLRVPPLALREDDATQPLSRDRVSCHRRSSASRLLLKTRALGADRRPHAAAARGALRGRQPFRNREPVRPIAGASKGEAHGAWAWDAGQAARTAVWAERD